MNQTAFAIEFPHHTFDSAPAASKPTLQKLKEAVGMVPKEQVMVMIIAVMVSTAVMAISVNQISAFVEKHPTVKMLALAFLLLIGFTLIIEGLHFHIPKGYVYFAMGFSVFVEMINLRVAKKHKSLVPFSGTK